MPTATISKISDTKTIQLPSFICDEVGLKTDDVVSLSVQKNDILIHKKSNDYSIKNLIKSWDGKRYIAEEINWGSSAGSEIW